MVGAGHWLLEGLSAVKTGNKQRFEEVQKQKATGAE